MRAVLSGLAEFGEGTLETFFPKKYGYTAIWRPLLGSDRKKKIDRHAVSSVLWRLQSQGLVARAGARRQSRWRLTKKGRALQVLADTSSRKALKKDGISRLVIFDIPERQRSKRDTVRAELIGCGFRLLQKSVWIGACPLPKDFLELIDDLELTRYVHIFSIRESGTIGV